MKLLTSNFFNLYPQLRRELRHYLMVLNRYRVQKLRHYTLSQAG